MVGKLVSGFLLDLFYQTWVNAMSRSGCIDFSFVNKFIIDPKFLRLHCTEQLAFFTFLQFEFLINSLLKLITDHMKFLRIFQT